MTLSHRLTLTVLALLAALGVTLGAAWVGYQTARADGPHHIVDPLPSAHPYRDTYVAMADATEAPAPATGDTVPPIAAPLDELAALKAKYDALRAAKDGGSKDLIWFAYALLGAAVIRVLLAVLAAYQGDKPKTWAKWTALGLAVPIYLLTYYAAGAGLWAAIVMAGAGPGAIVVNELLKRKPS